MSSAHAHEHHVSPFSTYATIFGILLVLTVITVAISALSLFHGAMSIIVAMLVAVVKASLVAAYFMHLKWDRAFNRIVFIASLWFAALFFIFTMIDLSSRGRVDPIQEHNVPTLEKQAKEGGAAKPAEGGGHH